MATHICTICGKVEEAPEEQPLPDGWRVFGTDDRHAVGKRCTACHEELLQRFKQANEDAEQSP